MVGPAELAQMLAEQEADRSRRLEAGIPALERLAAVAVRDTGQSQVCGRFLLGLYNGNHYRFNLNELRRLDADLVEDCLTVLRMDAMPAKEVHQLLPDGGRIFRSLRIAWSTDLEAEGLGLDERAEWHRRHV